MSELEKYQKVNAAESFEDLKNAIIAVADENAMVQGRARQFELEKQLRGVDLIKQGSPVNLLTRSYGIRQQMLYLIHYAKF